MFGNDITIGQAGIVCLFSIVVVFLVLLSVSYLIDVTAAVIRRSESKGRSKASVSDEPAPAEPAVAVSPAGGVDKRKAAVIAAAVAAIYSDSDVTPVIRKISSESAEESLWNSAGRTSVRQL